MPASSQSGLSNNACSTRSALRRPIPKLMVRETSFAIRPALSFTAAWGVPRRTAMFPQAMSKPTPLIEMLLS